MKKDDQFYGDMQKHIAISAVGPSALRNQGSAGVIKAAQERLADINLQIFRTKNEGAFLRVLDDQTEVLRRALPRAAQNWGAARKALNLFLRGICYNRFLCEKHGLALVEEWMEIPLDSMTAASLKRKATRGDLPQWPGLNGLTPDVSSKFQALAKQVASEQSISRIHLDMRLWAEERERTANQQGLMRPARSPSILCSRSRGLLGIYRVMLRRGYAGGGENQKAIRDSRGNFQIRS